MLKASIPDRPRHAALAQLAAIRKGGLEVGRGLRPPPAACAGARRPPALCPPQGLRSAGVAAPAGGSIGPCRTLPCDRMPSEIACIHRWHNAEFCMICQLCRQRLGSALRRRESSPVVPGIHDVFQHGLAVNRLVCTICHVFPQGGALALKLWIMRTSPPFAPPRLPPGCFLHDPSHLARPVFLPSF